MNQALYAHMNNKRKKKKKRKIGSHDSLNGSGMYAIIDLS
jgi:hypothetical protein